MDITTIIVLGVILYLCLSGLEERNNQLQDRIEELEEPGSYRDNVDAYSDYWDK